MASRDKSPSRAEVEAQLDRLLGSESFSGAVRSQRFLRFVVGEVLAGREERIHGTTIGMEVFERPHDFDPQADPIVRVEAGRLRRRLERHYLTDGADDPVLIEIPKGCYVPRFSSRVAARKDAESRVPADLVTSVEAPRRRRPSRAIIAAAGLLILVAVSYGAWHLLRMDRLSESTGETSPSGESPIRTVVMPFSYDTTAPPHPFMTTGLVEELIANLAALPGVEVVALGSAAQAAAAELSPEEMARVLDVDYVIRGSVRQERDRVRVSVSAIEASGSLVRLSKVYEGLTENILDLQADVAVDIASALAVTVTPAVESRLKATGMRDPEALALYYQAATLRDPPSDPVRSQLAESAYRRVIELDPGFAGGYAGLAYVLATRAWWGLSEQPDTDAQNALHAARTAVEKDPEFGWSHMSLGIALNVVGDHDGSLRAARRAVVLAPNDPYVLAFSALLQAYAGELEAGPSLARSAIRLDPLSARTPYRNIAGLTLFHSGRFEEALEVLLENVRVGGPDGPHMAYYRAATYARLGRVEDGRRELERASSFPYEFDLRAFLSAFRDPREANELLAALESLGFDPEERSASQTP